MKKAFKHIILILDIFDVNENNDFLDFDVEDYYALDGLEIPF